MRISTDSDRLHTLLAGRPAVVSGPRRGVPAAEPPPDDDGDSWEAPEPLGAELPSITDPQPAQGRRGDPRPRDHGLTPEGADRLPSTRHDEIVELPPTVAEAPLERGTQIELWRRLGARHLQAVALIGVVVLVAVAMHLFRARPEVVPLPEPPSPTPTSLSATASATPTRPASVMVHVLGEVRRPGVITLTQGARIWDAITAAGGVTPKARLGMLNLAAPVTDGMQVVVGGSGQTSSAIPLQPDAGGTSPARGAHPSASGAPSPGAGARQVNLNTATQAELEELPGVGPVMAGKIIAWREQHGGFRSVDDLQEVDGVGAKTFARLQPLVTV